MTLFSRLGSEPRSTRHAELELAMPLSWTPLALRARRLFVEWPYALLVQRGVFGLLALSGGAAMAGGAIALLAHSATTDPLPLGLPWMHGHVRLHAPSGFFLAIVGLAVLAASLYGPGHLSAALGVLYALQQNNLKRLLASSSIENVGIIAMGVGFSMIFLGTGLAELGAIGRLAALYHALNHSVFKNLLFLAVGSVLRQAHEAYRNSAPAFLHLRPGGWTRGYRGQIDGFGRRAGDGRDAVRQDAGVPRAGLSRLRLSLEPARHVEPCHSGSGLIAGRDETRG
jgi:hypothetical protein